MSQINKLYVLKILLGISPSDVSKDNLLNSFLSDAEEEIINRVYPYQRGEIIYTVPPRYTNKQIKIAAYIYSKIGAEGQTKHNENGINREWGSSNIPDDLIKDIVPFTGSVPRSVEPLINEIQREILDSVDSGKHFR